MLFHVGKEQRVQFFCFSVELTHTLCSLECDDLGQKKKSAFWTIQIIALPQHLAQVEEVWLQKAGGQIRVGFWWTSF